LVIGAAMAAELNGGGLRGLAFRLRFCAGDVVLVQVHRIVTVAR
jgi:hypothetical protein